MKLSSKIKSIVLASAMVLSVASHAQSTRLTTAYGVLSTFAPTIITLVALGVIHDKEQLETLKGDAQDFLAEGQASELLSSAINTLRDSEESLQNLSDEEVAAAIVASVE